jgi:hypothetical protein
MNKEAVMITHFETVPALNVFNFLLTALQMNLTQVVYLRNIHSESYFQLSHSKYIESKASEFLCVVWCFSSTYV